MTKSFPSVADLLNEHGPLLISDLSRLYREMGLSESAARQRVHRRSDEVKTLFGLSFPRGARFLYIEDDFGDQRFYVSLINKLQETSSAYGAAISGLFARGGICLAEHWPIVSCAPDKQKGHISNTRVLDGLKQTKLVQEFEIAGTGTCIALNDRFMSWNNPCFRSKLAVERILRKAVQNWAVRLGWSLKDAIQNIDDGASPRFSTMSFDIVGPCCLNALTVKSKDQIKPGFYVCDVISGEPLEVDHVSGFIKKVETLNALRKLGRFQPMLLADAFSEEALRELRSRGIVAATPESLFGRQVAEALAELLRVLQKSAKIAMGNPEKLEKLFDRLSGLEGNLRGALFEMIAGHLVCLRDAGSIEIGVLVTDYASKDKADIDVRHVSQTKLVCYECKGHGPDVSVTMDEVKYWLEKQIPIMRAAHTYEARLQGLHERFEFWSTGPFPSEVTSYLQDRQKKIRKYQIIWRDGDDILSMAAPLKNKTMHKLLKRF